MPPRVNNKDTPNLSILIIGAGPAGLALAAGLAHTTHHTITVLERQPRPQPQGGPVFIQRPAQKAYAHLGLGPALQQNSVPGRSVFWSHSDKESRSPLMVPPEEDVAPQRARVTSRAGAQRFAFEAAVAGGVAVLFGKNVVRLDDANDANGRPRVVTDGGGEYEADLVVAADGIKSRVRELLFGDGADARPTGEVIFHSSMPRAAVRADPRLQQAGPVVLDGTGEHFTLGPGRMNIFSAADEPGEEMTWAYSCVLDYGDPPASADGNGSGQSWYRRGDAAELRRLFAGFPDKDVAAFEHIKGDDDCWMWYIGVVPPGQLPSWRSKSGRVVLLGDAAHGMIPHLGQGLSQAIESAAALCRILQFVTATGEDGGNNIPELMEKFERFRRPRADKVAKLSGENSERLMQGDGEGQEARDAGFRRAGEMQKEGGTGRPWQEIEADMAAPFLTPPFNAWLHGYDVVAELDRFMEEGDA